MLTEFLGEPFDFEGCLLPEIRGCGKGVKHRFALGEPLEGGSGVSDHDASGAERIEQSADERLDGFFRALRDFGGVTAQVGGMFGKQLHISRGEWLFEEDAIDRFGDLLIVRGLLLEGLQIGVTDRIEESEACKVAFGSELLGGGGEEQQAGTALRKGFYARVFRAWSLGRPVQVVRLIDDEQIPARFEGLSVAVWILNQEGKTAEDELVFEEGINARLGGLNSLAAFGIKEAEEEIETAPEFDKPLMEEGVGKQDEDAPRTTGEVESV
jgi:hypothetical protein